MLIRRAEGSNAAGPVSLVSFWLETTLRLKSRSTAAVRAPSRPSRTDKALLYSIPVCSGYTSLPEAHKSHRDMTMADARLGDEQGRFNRSVSMSSRPLRFAARTASSSKARPEAVSEKCDRKRKGAVVRESVLPADEMILTGQGATQIAAESAISKKVGQENGMACFGGGGGRNER